MRSKRSKAWHRRKDEKLRARRLIEQGVDREPYFVGIMDLVSQQMRKTLDQIRLNALNGGIILRPALRRYDPSKSD